MKTELAIPTVHLNGTSKQQLLDQISDAIAAVHEAGRKLAAAFPNGRDFYPQGPEAIGRAMDQHGARQTKLREVATELEAIATIGA